MEVLEGFKSEIQQKINDLKQTITLEGTTAFQYVISGFEQTDIYFLVLYYNAGSYSYILPSFCSEAGLTRAAKHHKRHYPFTLEQQKRHLRWSVPDSPHHSMDELEGLMPETDRLASEIQSMVEKFVGELEAVQADNLDGFLDFESKFYESVNKDIHIALLDAVNEIRKNNTISEFLQKSGCIIGIAAGDQSYEELLDNLRSTNPPENLSQLEKDIEYFEENAEAENRLFDEYREKISEKMPETSLTVDDFSEIISAFEPEFIEIGGSIYLDNPDGFHSGGSRSEYGDNRIKLMELLSPSPHFDELDKLFGHFIGAEFTHEDLLPQIADRIADKLAKRLQKQFPENSFYIYSIVERSSLYYITFYQNRHDGFFPEVKLTNSRLSMRGAKKLRTLGPAPATIKLPCCLFVSEGSFYAQAYGIYYKAIYTDKTADPRAIIAGSPTSWEDALLKLEEVVLDQINICTDKCELDFETIEYPFADFKILDNEIIVSSNEFQHLDFIDKWVELEVQPEYLKMYLTT